MAKKKLRNPPGQSVTLTTSEWEIVLTALGIDWLLASSESRKARSKSAKALLAGEAKFIAAVRRKIEKAVDLDE